MSYIRSHDQSGLTNSAQSRAIQGVAGIAMLLLWRATAAAGVPVQGAVQVPVYEHSVPFSWISDVRELGDGRVLVLDATERRLRIVDPRSGKDTVIGRRGRGPNEFGYPLRLIRWRADSSLVYDPENLRLHVVTPDGTVNGTLRMFDDVTGAVEVDLMHHGPRLVGDALGHLYSTGRQYRAGVDGAQLVYLDSVPVERRSITGRSIDTVAFVKTLAPATPGRMVGGMAVRSALGPVRVFDSHDQWSVLGDGSVVVARLTPYSVLWRHPDRRSSDVRLQHRPVRVTQEVKDEYIRQIASRSRRPGGRLPPVDASRFEWPDVLPAFLPRALAVLDDGMVFIQRAVGAGELPAVDAVGAVDRAARPLRFPRGTRLVGAGARAVYFAREGDDGLQYLQVYQVSKLRF